MQGRTLQANAQLFADAFPAALIAKHTQDKSNADGFANKREGASRLYSKVAGLLAVWQIQGIQKFLLFVL